jgi:hypothetical protein
MKKAILVFPEYYDATTTSRRVLQAANSIFDEINILYWAKQGVRNKISDEIFNSIIAKPFLEKTPKKNIFGIIIFIKFQLWIIKEIIKIKPSFISGFTFYTIFPIIVYKFFFNWKCKIVYDPRDYISVCYKGNVLLLFFIRLIDNFFIKLVDLVIFPDYQYFIHYGLFKLNKKKYFILPNSTEDSYNHIKNIDIYKKFNIDNRKLIIPILGYFNIDRGKELLFEIINEGNIDFQFVVAGDISNIEDINFFKSKSNVTFLGKIPYFDALAIMYNSIIVPQLYDPSLINNKYAYPTKYYDCLMVGTPIIFSSGQIALLNVLKDHNIGVSIEYNDIEGFREVLINLQAGNYNFKKDEIREIFIEKYNYKYFRENLKEKYLSLMK